VSNKRGDVIERELAHRFPQPDAPQVLRKLPAPRELAAPAPDSARASMGEPARTSRQLDIAPGSSVSPPKPAHRGPSRPKDRPATQTKPLAPQRYKLQVTLSEDTNNKLRQAQQLLRHRVPNGDLAEVLDRALDLLVEAEMKRQFGQTKHPRKSAEASGAKGKPKSSRSRHIPNAVRRQVVERDGLQCSFTSAEGQPCSETGPLQLHHVAPFGKDGPHSVENVRLFCRAHNLYAAELDYGAAKMAQYLSSDLPAEVREAPVFCPALEWPELERRGRDRSF
jgi:hypothetical protein